MTIPPLYPPQGKFPVRDFRASADYQASASIGPFPFVFSPPASVKVGVMLLTGKAYVLLTGKTPRVQKKVANFT